MSRVSTPDFIELKKYIYLWFIIIKFMLAYKLLDSGVKSRSQQEIKAIHLSTLQIMCAVLISVMFCSSKANRWPGSNFKVLT